MIREKNDISASGYLDVVLDNDGTVSWQCQNNFHTIEASAHGMAIDAVTLSEIERAFTELFKQVAHRSVVGTFAVPSSTAQAG